MKKTILGLAVAAVSAASFADTYVWTGAGGDGVWMNAANWSVGGAAANQPPGVPWTEVTTSASKYDTISAAGLLRANDCVEFGPIANDNTEIDLDGLYAISNITIKAGAPTYTFGTLSDQILPLESSATLTLESGLENMPVMGAKFSLGSGVPIVQKSYITIENNTTSEFVIGDLSGSRRLTTGDSWSYCAFYLKGTGTYRFTGSYVRGDLPTSDGISFYLYAPKMTVASANLNIAKLCLQNQNVVCEIEKDAKLDLQGLNGLTVSTEYDASIIGEGRLEMRFDPKDAKSFDNSGRFDVNTGKTLTIEPTVRVARLSSWVEHTRMFLYGSNRSGILYVKGENETPGRVAFANGTRTFKTNHPGGFGQNDTIDFWVNGIVSPAYTNGDDFVKTLAVSGTCSMVTILNERETTMTARPTVVPLGESAAVTLCAKPVTAPIVLDATFTDGQAVTLGVDGAKETRPTAATLSAIAGVRLMGGTLDVSSAASNWSPAVPVTYDTGDATIVVPDGETYVFSSLGRTSGKSTGTLNIVCGTGRAKIAGAAAGAAPAGLKVNGATAEIRDGGMIAAPVTPASDRQIAAKGDVVPDAPSSVVGITTEGSGGNDTIAAAATAVKELMHVVGADATVEIGEGNSLSAGKVTLVDFAGNLSVGVAGDAGEVGSTNGTLVLKNDCVNSDLAVNAKLSDGTRVQLSGGAASVAGGSTGTNSVLVTSGALTITGERPYLFDFVASSTNREVSSTSPEDWPTIRFDGAKDVTLGKGGMHAGYAFPTDSTKVRSRIVVTNSLIRSHDIDRTLYPVGEEHSIVVGNRCSGILEIQEGAVITNRLVVGAPQGGNYGLGAVYQSGGELAMLSYYGGVGTTGGVTYDGAGVSASTVAGYGYYDLSGGRLIGMGQINVGSYHRGYMRQTGGLFVVTNHPSDKTASPSCQFNVGGANGGYGMFWMSGGRLDTHAGIVLSGGHFSNSASYSIVTVDGDAEFDSHRSTIKLINTYPSGGATLAKPHHSYFNINGRATVRARGFGDQSKTSADIDPTNRYVALSFNGGTFKPSVNSTYIFHSLNNYNGTAYSVEHVYAYSGGMVVDTDGKTGTIIDIPIEGPTGGGVSKVNFNPTEAQASWHLPPFVEITGDGFGATAAVEWDSATKTFKGVTVTSPGVNYTHATAKILLGYDDGTKTYLTYATCDIAENANTGSFTKKGEGDLSLEAANTYGGDTVLAGGVLRVRVTGALPSGSALVPQGGILEVASGVELPAAITVKLQNPDADEKFDLMRFPAGFPETLPVFTVVGGGENVEWVVRQQGDKLVVGAKRGFSVIIR